MVDIWSKAPCGGENDATGSDRRVQPGKDGNMNASPLLFDLWAKTDPWHPLPCHLVDVGKVAEQLLQQGPFQGTLPRFLQATGFPGSEADLSAWLAFLAALHDLGKCHAEFQVKGGPDYLHTLKMAGLDCIQTAKHFRHEAVSAAWVLQYLQNSLLWDSAAAATVAGALRGHHGNFRAEAPVESPTRKSQWEPLRAALANRVAEVFRPPVWEARFPDHSTAGLLLAGLIVLSDWIASNPDLFEMKWQRGDSLAEYAAASQGRAQQAIQRLGLNKSLACPQSLDFRGVWPNLEHLRPLQTVCQQAMEDGLPPGLTIIEAPMGEGKTEAALYLATRWIAQGHAGGMYVALPTAATSNQMFQRVQKFVQRHDPEAVEGVQLVHGTGWLLDRATPENAPELSDEDDPEAGERALDWFRPRKRSLIGTLGVGTIDQAEMSVLNVKHGFLRLYGLAHKVLIIDEVHAYDAYQTEIIKRLLGWCHALSLPVILLSATLPQRRKDILVRAYAPDLPPDDGAPEAEVPYPLITHAQAQGRLTLLPVPPSDRKANIRLEMHGLLEDRAATAGLVASRVQRTGGCHVVIVNTVDDAQAIYRQLAKILPDAGSEAVDLRLFHARFPVRDRQRIEQEVLTLFDKGSIPAPDNPVPTRRPARAVLVATQVVEQSLDLDFDEMFTQIAPIDLLLQRSGRLHRHDRPQRPTGPQRVLHVLIPAPGMMDFGATGTIYHPYILLQTLWQLRQSTHWQLPDQMRELVERVYGETDPGDSWYPGLADLRKHWQAKEQGDEDAALPHLIPEPYARSFKMAGMLGGALDENEGAAHSYFTARTRLGDDSIRVLLLENEEYQEYQGIAGCRRAPPRDVLKALYLRTVNLPRWWFADIRPLDGFELPQNGPVWLPGTEVLRLQNRCWRGEDQGQRWVIQSDPVYGIRRYNEEM